MAKNILGFADIYVRLPIRYYGISTSFLRCDRGFVGVLENAVTGNAYWGMRVANVQEKEYVSLSVLCVCVCVCVSKHWKMIRKVQIKC